MATRKKAGWAPFPHASKAYDYAGAALAKAWPALHAGDGEPFPDDKRAAALIKAAGKSAPKGMDAATLALQLQEAWRAFQVDDEDEQVLRYQRAAELAEAAIAALPGEANSHYRHAFALGRYSQRIAITKALKMGLAVKVRTDLERTLELAPGHAEAHTALALYHAEIISKIGSLIGGMTYGAKASEAEKHIAQALKLTPDSPIAHVEHANLLLLLHGDRKESAAAKAFEKAGKLKPRDAMEALDGEYARAQIE